METGLLVSSVLLWLFLLLNFVLTLGIVRRLNANAQAARKKPLNLEMPHTGEPAPDFSAQTLDGETVSLATYAGKKLALLFISANCTPCRDFLPQAEALCPSAEQAGVKLVLASETGQEKTRTFLEELEVSLPALIAPHETNSLFDAYKATLTPAYCLIDEQGFVLSSGLLGLVGGEWEKLSSSWKQPATPVASAREN